jgi:hypothetical protein
MALETLNATPDEQPTEQGFLANAPKGKGLSPAGQIAMDPKQTAELLANMQEMVDERTGAFNTFMGGLKDATAWGSGGVNGPTQALAVREADKNKELNDVYNMRTQMAAYKAAQAQQEAFNEQQKNMFGGGKGGAGSNQGVMVNGTLVDPEIASSLSRARSKEEFDKIFNDFTSKRAQAYGNFINNPAAYKNDIDRVNERNQLVPISALEAKRSMGPGSVSPEAIKQVESGGRPGLVSSAGAEGTMQVMPNTQTNPGYGVTPARDKSQTELERVGRDYYGAMQKHYGDDTIASIAYNMGPGATDAWIKKGGHFKDLPAETRDYIGQVHLANAKLNRAPAEMAPQTSANIPANQRMTVGEARNALKGQEAQLVAEGTATGKFMGGKEATIIEGKDTSGERLASLQYLDGLINNPKTSRVFGVFQKPDFVSAVGAVVDKGIRLGRIGDIGVDLEPLVRATMRGASPTEIDAVQKATREFAKIKLNEAKILLAGQGAVSDAERGLVQELSGSVKNSPGALRDYLAWGKMRAEYDRKAGDALDAWRSSNPQGSFTQFRLSPEAVAVRKEYDDKLKSFAAKTGLSYGGNTEQQQQQLQQSKPSPLTYSDPDKEKRYQLYRQNNGPK